jgi:hypothetical protein
MEERIDKRKAQMGRISRDVTKIQQDVAVIRGDVDCIKRDLVEVRADLRGFRNRQERDFRLLFGAIMFVALELTGVLAKGFGWIQ